MKKKLKDRVKHMGIALWLLMNEKTFRRNDTRLKYLFYKGNSDVLIVSFSAYNKEKALYNYIRTLKNIDASKLYIKDDFSKNKKGSYYLGEKGKHNVEGTVCELDYPEHADVHKYFPKYLHDSIMSIINSRNE